MVDDKLLNEVYRKVDKLEKEYILRNDKYFNFFKIISTLSITMIGLLISLKSSDFPNLYSKIFFLAAISLLSLTVIFSLIVQYNEHKELNYLIDHRKKVLISLTNNKDLGNIEVFELTKSSSLKYVEIATYCSLVLSLLSLILYTSFLIF
jgi:hypothetical protein